MEDLSQMVEDLVLNGGAIAYGIATLETLEGGPPSTDLSYVLPEAKSAVCFALALDQRLIPPFLAKKDYVSHNRDNTRTNLLANGIALDLASFLTMKGYPSIPVAANNVYRKDTRRGPLDEMPEISHRYLAVRSGIGHFGLSGNVIRKEEGAAIILASVVTAAELSPTDPLPKEDNYCDSCRLCMASCASGLMSSDEIATVTLGGVDFTYSKRRGYIRCDYVCGGYAGLHRSGKWSTWSPARFPIPEREEDFRKVFKKALKAYSKRPKPQVSFFHPLIPTHRGEFTCGNCQLICHPDKEERKKRHKTLTESGVVVQDSDGCYRATSPDDAIKHLSAMSPRVRSLYENIPEQIDQ
jgi:epoxyqueuosine reductase QueG